MKKILFIESIYYLFFLLILTFCFKETLKLSHMDKETNQYIEDKAFSKEIGTVLRGAKDWFGGRKQRSLSAPENIN